jgi:hypothetical protein
MMLALAILGAAQLHAVEPASAQAPPIAKWLVLEFPDGVRSSRGRIRGNGKRPERLDEPFANGILHAARRCGAAHPMYTDNVTHRSIVISWSTPNDHAVVACLKAGISYDFNAGLADVGTHYFPMDAGSFADLETAFNTQPLKAR